MSDDATTDPARSGTQGETPEEMQARHRKEKRELQARVTGKKKSATKKTRKGVNDECTDMERRLAEQQAGELAFLLGSGPGKDDGEIIDGGDEDHQQVGEEKDDEAEDVARGVGHMKLGAPQEQAQEQTQGKKRNRQKERMARRQAEQIAAAEAAEGEALSMTDHRAIERAAMASAFKSNSLVEREIRPDGHCLFSAVADQLEHRGVPLQSAPGAGAATASGTPGYRVVRGVAARWVEDRGDDFAPFLEEDLGDYVARMRDTAEWGGQIELQALAGAYNLEINVVQNGATEKIQAGDGGGGREGEVERIWLAYYRHGYGLGEHYNSLRTAPS